MTPIFSSLWPASGITKDLTFQPARILTVTGVFGTDSITAAVISSIKHKSLSAADPAPFFVIFGTGTAKGEERAVLAAQQAISSPLLDNASISGAQGVLVNITGGSDLAIMEVDQATNIIFEEAGQGANIIFGAVIDPSLNDEIMVTVIATGFNHKSSSDELTNKRIESHLENQQQFKSVTEQENVPLHQQDTANTGELEQKQIENSAPAKLFDDLSPAMRENDLDVPAFIRRQQD